MEDFSQSNAKLMATTLFFEYIVYSVFGIIDQVKKEGTEYIYLNEKVAEALKQNAAIAKEEAKLKKEEKKKASDTKKKGMLITPLFIRCR